MATTDKGTLLGWIVSRWKPTVAQFKAFAESYWHKDEQIPTSSIEGLDNIMNGVATEEFVTNSINEYDQSVSELITGLSAKSGIIDKTYAELTDMITAGTLSAGSLYKITDRGDRGIILRAVSASQLSRDGIRIMLCPATYAAGVDAHGNNWIGVWHSTKTATFNCLAIWNGLVWRNLTGAIGTVSDDIGNPLDSTNWQVIAKASFANHEYVELVFGCSYDVGNDWINEQWDNKRNRVGNYDDGKDSINYSDRTDWNIETSGCLFFGNKCGGIFNNIADVITFNVIMGTISGNKCFAISYNSGSDISDNVCAEGGVIEFNTDGSINDNNCLNISRNSCSVGNNTVSGDIKKNTCLQIVGSSCVEIAYNSNNGVITNCAITGTIGYNKNNGDIQVTGTGSVMHNVNNGNLYGNIYADLTDSIVNKP